MGWSARFDAPIPLADGRQLATLLDAANYVAALPPKLQTRPEWQAAAEALLLVAERNGPPMMARIGMMRALNAGNPPPQRKRSPRTTRLIR
ncbi:MULTISPECIES: hypothetical protein [unclassified Bradyrhizobium]|uniref:hypothetical protein n=1 Tax=unclassified Bradyrhizobium TaxID=2631580 RepID=UPI00211EE383|nr:MULTISPECIES: hypothetical protein [unclassified Bradyrhizobium]MDD1534575.1 hypothetical protein [Bradyrhizobium sp. WBOS8]MDD1581439.1 hypothetical protein [Bradyrhizobium sp. WBOS4]UUO49727.1 hypothetical protein DCM78_24135 [Bradyrhizobium sp. WBOS04]UUO58493.1 hypothetical protein DCM80_04415 [Bradyrhizobium sp. WBOS08]